ncbi:MAG TPA: ABC transporter ATP-binding protein [Burkholderiaceae bacterium]|nr:ABC transporter ATP-binding protein [Burkholderiaceae bacterium]
MLSLQGIRKSYKIGPSEVEVLKGVSLDVASGDLLSISGPSGCGKSTLMNILGLLDRPTAGHYTIQGKPVAYDSDDELSNIRNRSIGFVFQQYHLLPKLTALENVTLPMVYRGASKALMLERGMRTLKLVGMDGRSHHKPSELSGGQQQRVAIARALAGSPQLILADEPTGALDARVGQDIMDLFLQLNSDQHITIAIITHDSHVARQCRRQAVMRDGELHE